MMENPKERYILTLTPEQEYTAKMDGGTDDE